MSSKTTGRQKMAAFVYRWIFKWLSLMTVWKFSWLTLMTLNTHITNVCTKANRTLVYLRRNRYSCPLSVKEAAYKGPVLEYGSSVLDPHTQCLREELEKVQNRAARFVTGNYVFETGSMTDILGQLKWESLKKRRKDSYIVIQRSER